MVVYQCPHCGQSFTPAPRLYTPTLHGFERFLRDMVGLQAGPGHHDEAQEATY